ncbi:hypothetical protein GGR57DRAFT_388122 [Xylariaceae sp. FL1272]|nr:hypothetical protein GGR57DRAFT_388122 [Xylariaceae sp. FL1272]
MKLLTLLALAASTAAYRCRMDRYTPITPGSCVGATKAGDQTNKEPCSDKHTNSCYGRPIDEKGDPNCKVIITKPGCVAPVLGEVWCDSDDMLYISEEHSYYVGCLVGTSRDTFEYEPLQ